MIKAVRPLLASCALLGAGVLLSACGGVPGNAVATVDGNSIDKASYEHWLNIAAKSSGQPGAAVPDPPNYTKCIAAKRKSTPKPAKGQPKTTDAQLKTQCEQQYKQLRDQVLQLLISFKWIQGEAKEQSVKVTDAEVKKSFDQQRKQSFPKEKDFQKFLKQNGYTVADLMQRVRLDLLSNKIRDKVVKGKDHVTEKQIDDFYNKNKSRFAQPERRDLRIVLTKSKGKAAQAKRALESGQPWKTVAKKFSIDQASKSQGGKLPAQAKGTLEKQLDEAVFSAKKGQLKGPVKTQFGYYVFTVEKIQKASQQTLEQAKETIRQTLSTQNQQKALDKFVADFQKKWKEKTDCREGYVIQQCKQGPKPTPTPAQPPTVPNQPNQQPGQ